jgi:hypothetical protein
MREDTLGPKYNVRLGDLRSWHVLQVTCLQCRRVATIHPGPLLKRFGEHQRLAQLEEKFGCTGCGSIFRSAHREVGDGLARPSILRRAAESWKVRS